jgi:hypothetical protein
MRLCALVKDFPTDLAVALQPTALILCDSLTAGFALLHLFLLLMQSLAYRWRDRQRAQRNRDEKTTKHAFLLSSFVWQRQSKGAVPIEMGYLS